MPEQLHVGTKRQVFNNRAIQTKGGLKKEHLERVKRGQRRVKQTDGTFKTIDVYAIVSRRKRQQGQANQWIKCMLQAKNELNLTGFVLCKKGTPLYERAIALHNEFKVKSTNEGTTDLPSKQALTRPSPLCEQNR